MPRAVPKSSKPSKASKLSKVSRPSKPRMVSAASTASKSGGSRSDPAVDDYLRALRHPRKAELESLRRLILGVDPAIREGLKWKAPSFRTTDDFATTNVHTRDRVRLILHTGAKVKGSARTGLKIDDPTGLLVWLGKDRCLITIGDAQDFAAKRKPLQAIIRQWIRAL